jgi:uncharacterized repeat protein (TIGR01451 family)
VPPSSHVLPLAVQSQQLQFAVSWTGQDDIGGSGVASYNIYASDDSGPWILWQSATTNTTATFQGQPHHTYGFYSQARDNAGNLEAAHFTADATTTVVANPLLLLTVTPANTSVNMGDTFNSTITVSNIGSLNLTNVIMSNAMPAGISVDNVSYGRGASDIEDMFIDWSLGNLNTNKGSSMTVTATIVAGGVWTNYFTVADSQGTASASTVQVITVAGPVSLTITVSEHQVVLAWPTSAGSYVLQATPDLTSQSIWNAVTNTRSVIGFSDTVTLPITNASQFFRLQRQ